MEKEGNGEGNREAIAIQLSVTQKPLGKKKKKTFEDKEHKTGRECEREQHGQRAKSRKEKGHSNNYKKL